MQLSYSQHQQDNIEGDEQEESKKEDDSEDSDEEELQSEIITYMIISDEATATDLFWTSFHYVNLVANQQLAHTFTTHVDMYTAVLKHNYILVRSYTHWPC